MLPPGVCWICMTLVNMHLVILFPQCLAKRLYSPEERYLNLGKDTSGTIHASCLCLTSNRFIEIISANVFQTL